MDDVEEAYLRCPDPPDFAKQITIIVGNEQEPDLSATFSVPEHFLLDKSAFFRAACRNQWKEAVTRTVKLPQIEVATFQLYLQWVYKRRIDISMKTSDTEYIPNDHIKEALTSLAKLWVMGDQLMDSKLRNEVVDTMVKVTGADWQLDGQPAEVFPAELTTFIWQNTSEGSDLRNLTLDFHTSTFRYGDMNEALHEYDPEYVKDLLNELLDMLRSEQHPWTPTQIQRNSRCYYHSHGNEDPGCPEA